MTTSRTPVEGSRLFRGRHLMARASRLAVFGLVCLTSGAAQAPVTPKGQWPPARDWPPGWKLYEPYPEELAFVVPQATTKLASEVRTLTDGRSLAPSLLSSKV